MILPADDAPEEADLPEGLTEEQRAHLLAIHREGIRLDRGLAASVAQVQEAGARLLAEVRRMVGHGRDLARTVEASGRAWGATVPTAGAAASIATLRGMIPPLLALAGPKA